MGGFRISFVSDMRFDSGSTQRIYEWHNPDGTFVKTIIEFVDDTKRDPIHEEFLHDIAQGFVEFVDNQKNQAGDIGVTQIPGH